MLDKDMGMNGRSVKLITMLLLTKYLDSEQARQVVSVACVCFEDKC